MISTKFSKTVITKSEHIRLASMKHTETGNAYKIGLKTYYNGPYLGAS